MTQAFPSFPPVGSSYHEVSGVLTFFVALYAAYLGVRFLATNLNTAKP